ncbi:MAG: hypothetical protein QF819_08145 [Gemmatimonadota bacterium]|nr:hypothetical protein [Gemmatimonadota bacterium]MDP6529568.1 hypothetical protein [Gemmatimonadota bacterium]MDP6803129.1 hypothetical protein [Gemmatimonadota bacterium]MDP7031908.1 hypothetical protein [Gemmatimonadota bacterium]
MAAKAARDKARTTPAGSAGRVRWERRNVGIFLGGLGAIAIGYLLLSGGSITMAPILLVLGYCVLIPLAFIL